MAIAVFPTTFDLRPTATELVPLVLGATPPVDSPVAASPTVAS